MGHPLITLSSILLLFLTTFPCFTTQCESFKSCTPVDKWTLNLDNTGPKTSKTCDDNICAAWFCVVNGAVIYGAGCYSDFKATCPSSTEETSKDFKKFGTPRYETLKERENFLFVCRNSNGSSIHHNLNFEGEVKLYKGFLENGEFINGAVSKDTCPLPPPSHPSPPLSPPSHLSHPSPAEPGNNGFMNQMNGFKLFGMILLGFIFT
uniref:Uncharacterized protein n=1 Tax=Panagrolaimus sp. ES5 TaxID=591445 RepID=A0AC34F915_9BILA